MVRKPCQHTEDVEGCRPCWLARHDARYRKHWGIPGEPEPLASGKPYKPAPRPPAPLPCVHLGDRLTGQEREALRLDHRRDWRACGAGYGAVCRCTGCGPKCPDYEAEEPPA